MCGINPFAIVFVALAAVVGALLGNVLVGLAIGLGIVAIATLSQLGSRDGGDPGAW